MLVWWILCGFWCCGLVFSYVGVAVGLAVNCLCCYSWVIYVVIFVGLSGIAWVGFCFLLWFVVNNVIMCFV